MAPLRQRWQCRPARRTRVVGLHLLMCLHLTRALAAHDEQPAIACDRGGARTWRRQRGRCNCPAALCNVVHIDFADCLRQGIAAFMRGTAPTGGIQLAVEHHRMEVIARMRCVGQLRPLLCPGVESIQPGHVAAHVATRIAADQIQHPGMFHRTGGTATALRGNLRPDLPMVGLRVVDQHVGERGFFGIVACKATHHVELAGRHHGLGMIDHQRRRGALRPPLRGGIEDLQRPVVAPTQQVQTIINGDHAVLMARMRRVVRGHRAPLRGLHRLCGFSRCAVAIGCGVYVRRTTCDPGSEHGCAERSRQRAHGCLCLIAMTGQCIGTRVRRDPAKAG